ncbi:DNA repair protein RecN [Pseudoalteromonas denitrificans]|uniref:DNA repair protein RecN n=1 Tax=Pseudoalteromonas denitrificans DSM 6059 TaxID=1123010 RepID=A0A1I1TBK7_9GAMM|nr:DNA repair protein RecN [Pseudoalteromonas denitrificans]SFD56037.1 DNA repair protein RecN (Recombination protein N) [Pseudoalteromonas denitrificans DSM 6059]
MLISLEIENFAIVDKLNAEWGPGMTTITGETGAGKSIAIDALSLCLGERSEASAVRPGSERAQVSAQFDIHNLPKAQEFLANNDLLSDGECLIRRSINNNGRSKGYINGIAVTASQLKCLGQYLISIHGQHAHQLLTKPEHQLHLLDEYAGHTKLQSHVKQTFKDYQELKREFQKLSEEQVHQEAQQQLLQYQVQELDEFSLTKGEFEQIEIELNKLSHSQTLLDACQQQIQNLFEQDGTNAFNLVQSSASQLSELAAIDNALTPISELLYEASIQIEEATNEIKDYQAHIECDPIRLIEVEERMSQALTLARKHQIQPEQLYQLHQELIKKLDNISTNNARLSQLEQLITEALVLYHMASKSLSASRVTAATNLNQLISASMQHLSMEHGLFEISLVYQPDITPNKFGSDSVEFLVSTNPGQPLQPLAKVASGGELSRISLAIQVIIAGKVTTPTLIFDEVDVGISGPTAAAVGELLRKLGKSTQVICVTHLPQVASSGHQQFFVAKHTDGIQTSTQMLALDKKGRTDEIARLLGGTNISKATLTNAKELLNSHL